MGTMIQIHLVFILCCRLHSVQLLGVDVTCPSEFRDGESGNIVSCRINRTAVTSCSRMQPYVTFEQTTDSRPSLKCFTPSLNSSNCTPVLKPVTNHCWCNGTYGEVFEYKFAYFANQSRDLGTKLECKVCYEPTNGLDIRISESCINMRFGRPDSDGGLNVGLITGISIAVVVVLLVIVAIVILKRHHQRQMSCHKSGHKCNTTQSPVITSESVHMTTSQALED